MATLNETAHLSRIIIKYGIIALIVLITGRFTLGVLRNVYLIINPPKPNPPTMGFGRLAPLDFPKTELTEITYSLETVTGRLPNFTDRMAVYRMPIERANFLNLERSKRVARQLGFEAEPEQLSEERFRWRLQASGGIPATLEMNITNGSFKLGYDWSASSSFLANKQLVNETRGADQVKNLLKSAGLLPDDLANGSYTVTYLKASGRAYTPTVSLSESDFVQYDFYRRDINNEYRIITEEPYTGTVRAILSNNPRVAWLVSLEYNYYPVFYESPETYPLKSVASAFEELQAGKGYLAAIDGKVNEVVIRRVELGYYDSFSPQAYLQPIYIFKGDNNFVAYVPAILPSLVSGE
jgi:hypothetical protein